MSFVVRHIAIPFFAIVALWVAVSSIVTSSAEALSGSLLAERLSPFGNAHLLEEALEGSYTPLVDPAFLLYSITVAAISFGCVSYFAALGVSQARRLYTVVPSLMALALLAWLLRYALSAGYPSPMRVAVIFLLGACFVASWFGVLLATRRSANSLANGG